MPQSPPRRSFKSLSSTEQERIRANIRKLESEGVDEQEVERYLTERENLERPGAEKKPSVRERLQEMKATHQQGKAKERAARDRETAIPATGKTADGAHILPRVTITQPSSPTAANKAHRPQVGEEVRAALPLSGKAAKAALGEALPHKLVQGMARGTVRIPTDLVAGAAALAGKPKVKEKALKASEKLSSLFGTSETPIGTIAELLPLEAAGLAAMPTLVPRSPRIRAPRGGAGRSLASAAMTKAEAEAAALLEETARETGRKSGGRLLPAPPERKLLKAPSPDDLLAGEKAIPEIAQLVRELQITPTAESKPVRRKVRDIPAEVGQRFARVYDALPVNDPKAKDAYDALNAEVEQQMRAIEKAGYRVEYVDSDPYKNSDELFEDLRTNRRMKVFKTGDDAAHPYMTKEQNNAFRAVHDFIAHGGGGNQFGKIGEENAYRIHASTLSPAARRALATETRGQNSWVNFGPESHRPVPERPFAKQKAALWPEELIGDYDDLPPEVTEMLGPAIPSHAPVKPPNSVSTMGEIANRAETARDVEKGVRLFGSPPAPPSPEDIAQLLLEPGMKPRSVGDLGKTLKQAGVPKHRRFTGQFLEGEAEKLHGPGRGRRGAADLSLLLQGGATVGGALGGAAMNDDPIEGALLGLGVGAAAGAVGGKLLKGAGTKIPRSAAMQAVADQIMSGTSKEPLIGMRLKDKFLHALDKWSPVEGIGEHMNRVGVRPSKNPLYMKDRVLSSYTRVHQTLRGKGLVDPNTMQVLGPSLEKVFEPIGQSVVDVNTAFSYLMARRVAGRVDKMGLKAVGGDADLAAQSLAAMETQHPALLEFGNRWKAYTESLGEYAVRSGLWTPEQWHLIEQSDAIYVPFRRMREHVQKHGARRPGAPGSALNIGSGVQGFSGSSKPVADLADAIADYTDALIKRADRYAFAQSFRDGVMEMAQKGHLEGLEIMTPATGSKLYQRKRAEQEVLDILSSEGIESGTAEVLADVYAPIISKDNPMLVLNKPGGGKEYWLVNSPELVKTLETLTPDRGAMTQQVINVLKVVKNVATSTKTGLSPGFAVANMGRDAWDAWGKTRDGLTFSEIGKSWYQVLSGSGAFAPLGGAITGGVIGSEYGESSTATTVGAVVGGAFGLKVRGALQGKADKALLETMETMGGIGSTSLVAKEVSPRASVARFAPTTRFRQFKAVVSDIVGKPIEALDVVISTSDTFARQAAWKAAVRSKQHMVKPGGWTERDLRIYAASQARGATVDFGRTPGSELLAIAADITPFLNAALQGSVRYGRAWKHDPKRMAMMSGGVATVAGLAWALNERGENPVLINDRPATERAAFIHFPIPDVDTKISIPLTQENGVIAASVGYALAQLSESDPAAAERLKESFKRLIPSTYLPVYTELGEIERNRAKFGNRPIETEKMEGLLPEYRKLPTTRPTFTGLARGARAVGERLDAAGLPTLGMETASPQQAEHLTRGIFGPFTDIAADVLTDEVAVAMGEDRASATPAPRGFWQHPMNPLRSIVRPGVPTRTQSEDTFYRTLDTMDKSGRSLKDLALGMTGSPDSSAVVNEFLNDPKRGGRLARNAQGAIDFTFGRRMRAQLNEVREAEKALLEQWRNGEIDEQTYRSEVARFRSARQEGYRQTLRDLHDAGITLEGAGNYPRR